MIKFQELSYRDSSKFLYQFHQFEKKSYQDLYTDRKNDARYIWALENGENPIGFLSFNLFKLANHETQFIYIVKIYVTEKYKGKEAILIENDKISAILFKYIENKNIPILTLVPANDNLNNYYGRLNFKQLPSEIMEIYQKTINTQDIIFWKKV